MAMEDSVCLSHMMAAHDGDIDRAFEAYRAQRVVRTARVQLGARAMGEHVYHPEGAHAKVRDAILKSYSVDDIYDRLAWLYGGTGLET